LLENFAIATIAITMPIKKINPNSMWI